MDDSQELTAPAPSRRPWLRIAGLALLCVAVAAAAWFVTSLIRADDKPDEIKVQPVAPVALSADGLRQLAGSVGQPIYWAGPKEGFLYELKRTENGSVYIRYLPEGMEAGAPDGPYLVVATYPYVNAYTALQNAQGGDRFELPRGGLAVVDARTPSSIHVAYPNSNYQAEVYDPSPERALGVARSGDVRPVG